MKASEFIDAVLAEIQQHGVTAWEVDYGHNHPRISFAWAGGVITHTVPGTPSNQRGILDNLSALRQRMGVKRIIAPKSASTKKRDPGRRQESRTSPPELSGIVKADPWAALVAVRGAVHNSMDEARAMGRAAFHRGLCGVPPASYAQHLRDTFLAGWRDAEWDHWRVP